MEPTHQTHSAPGSTELDMNLKLKLEVTASHPHWHGALALVVVWYYAARLTPSRVTVGTEPRRRRRGGRRRRRGWRRPVTAWASGPARAGGSCGNCHRRMLCDSSALLCDTDDRAGAVSLAAIRAARTVTARDQPEIAPAYQPGYRCSITRR